MARELLDLLILDAVADDVEATPHIAERVLRLSPKVGGPRVLARADLITALTRLVYEHLIEGCVQTQEALVPCGDGVWPAGELDDAWFRITPHGLMVHGAWKLSSERETA